MTVAALSPTISYLENGVTLAFAVPFRFDPAGGLAVKRIDAGVVTGLAFGVDWSATGGSSDAGGTLTLTASVAGAKLVIERTTARAQQTAYTTSDRFPATSHEAALDRLTMIVQEQDVGLAAAKVRTLRAPDGEILADMPGAALRKGKFLGFDLATGNPIAVSGTLGGDATMVSVDDGRALQDLLGTNAERASHIHAYRADGAFQAVQGFTVADNGVLKGLFISRNAIGVYANSHVLNVQHIQADGDDTASVNFNRVSGKSSSAGHPSTAGTLNQALRVINSVCNSDAYNAVTNPYGQGAAGAWDGEAYENGLLILLNNGRTHVDGAGYAGQNCALVAFGLKQHAAAGSTWGANIGVKEFAGSLGTSLTCALETDVHADGNDTNNVRLGVTAVMKSLSSVDGAPSGFGEGYTGMWVSADGVGEASDYASGAWFSRWKRGFVASGPMDVAFDASGTTNDSATAPFGVNGIAFRMSRSSYLSFTRDNARRMGVDNTNSLRYVTPQGAVIVTDDYGSTAIGGVGAGGSVDLRIFKAYHATKDAGFFASGNGVDMRMSATGSLGAAFLGTYSAHDLLLMYNGSSVARITSGNTIQPEASGYSMGNAANRWNFYGKDLTLAPSASVTPAANGDLVIQATSNTSLTFKFKGSDGIVRAASLTLT